MRGGLLVEGSSWGPGRPLGKSHSVETKTSPGLSLSNQIPKWLWSTRRCQCHNVKTHLGKAGVSLPTPITCCVCSVGMELFWIFVKGKQSRIYCFIFSKVSLLWPIFKVWCKKIRCCQVSPRLWRITILCVWDYKSSPDLLVTPKIAFAISCLLRGKCWLVSLFQQCWQILLSCFCNLSWNARGPDSYITIKTADWWASGLQVSERPSPTVSWEVWRYASSPHLCTFPSTLGTSCKF